MTDHGKAIAHAIAAELAELRAQRDELLEALRDMHNGWRYIREVHGDLYGVGWDRCEQSASAAIARCERKS